MKKEPYEAEVHRLLEGATVLDHSKSPCEESFVPETTVSSESISNAQLCVTTVGFFITLHFSLLQGKTYVMYIMMSHATDYKTWKQVAKVIDQLCVFSHPGYWQIFFHSSAFISGILMCGVYTRWGFSLSHCIESKSVEEFVSPFTNSFQAMWRFFMKSNHLLVVGVPASPYA